MSPTALQECLESIACPVCGTRVILTKERVLFCQHCCQGYPFAGGVPDLRLNKAINFKKIAGEAKHGIPAVFQIQQGKSIKDKIELKSDHCVVLGRAVRGDMDSDITYVGVNEAPIALNNHSLQLIEKFLKQVRGSGKSDVPYHPAKYLGGFYRDEDIFLDDRSVSRAHAVIYHHQDSVWVLDLVSKNGTYINGREVEKAKLKHNDMISIGMVGVRVKLR